MKWQELTGPEFETAVKADDVVPKLLDEFYDRCDEVGK
jgi:hypothetical protein